MFSLSLNIKKTTYKIICRIAEGIEQDQKVQEYEHKEKEAKRKLKEKDKVFIQKGHEYECEE